MIETSTGFDTEIIKRNYRKVYGKIQIDWTSPEYSQDVNISVNNEARISYKDHVVNEIEDPRYKWLSLDGSCIADGSYHPMPSTEEEAILNEVGWWGADLADAYGDFTISPVATLTFSGRPVYILKVYGDSKRGEYPVDFDIKLYDSEEALQHTENVVGNDQVKWEKDISGLGLTDIAKIEYIFYSWSHANRQCKIILLLNSVQTTHEGDEIFLIGLLEEREVKEASLPIGNISANELQIRIYNKDRIYDAGNTNSPFKNLIRPNRIIHAWLGCEVSGEIEWIPLGKYKSGEWKVPENEMYAETSATDLMEELSKKKYTTSTVLINNMLYDIAKDILEDFGLSEAAGDFWIDTELNEAEYTIPYAYLDSITHREALRLVVEAAMGQAYVDREGILRVEGPSYLEGLTTSQLTIDLDEIYQKDIPALYEKLRNKIVVTTQPFKPVDSKEDVYRSVDGITIPASSTKDITIFYEQRPVSEGEALLDNPPAGCTIDSAVYYVWGADITLMNTNATEQTVILYVKGKPFKISDAQEVIAKDDTSIGENGELVYEFPNNHFVQNETLANKIATKLLSSYKDPRRDLDMEWRGNPALELTDRITTYDYRDESTADFHVIYQELNYDGILEAVLKGRRA
jgi:hypothetical protein